MTATKARSSITEGGLVRPLFRLAWPIVVIQLLQVAYNVVDTLWLGRLSSDAVGALSLAFPLVFLTISVAGGFTAAGAILVAQYTGADSEGSAGAVAGQTISFVGVVAIGLGLVGFVLTDAMLGVLPSSPATAAQIVPLASRYMKVFFLGMPFLFGFFVFEALMRGYGNTQTPMRIMAISVLLNVLLDPVLIFGWFGAPALGIEGAAYATVISRGVASVMGFYVLIMTSVGPDIALADLLPDLEVIADIVRIGVPTSLEQSMSALAMITLTAMVVTFAPPVVAAYGLGNRLVSLVFLPAMGLGRATNTMVGQNLGADQADRAERAVHLAGLAAVAVLFVAALFAFAFPTRIVAVFMATGTPEAAETIRYGAEYLQVRSVEFVFIGVMQVLLGAYRGAGNTKTALVFSVLTLWVARVPLVYLLSFVGGLGPAGIWYGMAAGHVIGAIGAGLWFTRGTWKSAVVDTAGTPGAPAPED
ncbi:MAG: MATE family efflux transporter [Halobacteriales archaeon]|nr:MATE family efflux transporter [Halobacteriales archaeon]